MFFVLILHVCGLVLVFKFVEHPENNEKPMNQKSRVKFKIMCLKVKGMMEYVPELVGTTTVLIMSCHQDGLACPNLRCILSILD